MAMKRCPICGEKYSDTYKSCPFCEEEEALQSGSQIRRTAPARGGRRAAKNRRQPNLLSPILVVLIVIMAALLVYLLFGDQIAERLTGGTDAAQDQQVEDVTPDVPDTTDPETGEDVTMPESGDIGETEETDDGDTAAEQTDPATLPETLTIAYLGSPRTEFTMSVGDEPIPLTASGGSGTYTWSSSDDGIASVDASGKVTAVSAGQATLTVTDGSGKGTCLVRVRGGSAGSTTSAGGQHRIVRRNPDGGGCCGSQRQQRRAGCALALTLTVRSWRRFPTGTPSRWCRAPGTAGIRSPSWPPAASPPPAT